MDHGGAQRRDALRRFLADPGIETSVDYPAVHRFSIDATPDEAVPNTAWISDHELTLPSFVGMTDEQLASSRFG